MANETSTPIVAPHELTAVRERLARRFIEKNAATGGGDGKYSEKAIAIAKLLNEDGYGGYAAKLRTFAELVLGEKLPPVKENTTAHDVGRIYFSIGNVNDHNYTVPGQRSGLAFYATEAHVGIRAKSGKGSGIEAKESRPATEAEIREFVAALDEHQVVEIVGLELKAEAKK